MSVFLRSWTNGVDEYQQRLIRVAPVVALHLWSRWSTYSSVALWLNKCGATRLTSFGNPLLKTRQYWLSKMQYLFDQPLSKLLKPFNHMWFFLRSGSCMDYLALVEWSSCNARQWLVEKTHQVVLDSLRDYGRHEWQRTLTDWEKTPYVAYKDVLKSLTMFGVSKILLLLVAI